MEGILIAIHIGEAIFLTCAIWISVTTFLESRRNALLCLASTALNVALYIWLVYGFEFIIVAYINSSVIYISAALILVALGYICVVWVAISDFKESNESILGLILRILLMPLLLPFYIFLYAYTEWITWRKFIVGLIIAIGLLVVALAF